MTLAGTVAGCPLHPNNSLVPKFSSFPTSEVVGPGLSPSGHTFPVLGRLLQASPLTG